MNNALIRVCDIALNSLTMLQMENDRRAEKLISSELLKFQTATGTCGAINKSAMQRDHANKILESKKAEVKAVLDTLYQNSVVLEDTNG